MNLLLKNIAFISGLCLAFSFTSGPTHVSTTNDDNYVYWSERKLTWSDFQGKVPADSKFDALTHSAISLDYEGQGVTLKFNIESIFDPRKSWKKEGVNQYILQHEQVHFDITEYHARVLRKKLKTNRYKSIDTVNDEIRSMFNDSFTKANEMQLKYDEQTNHSMNRKKQRKWNKKIKKLLKKTRSYKHPKLKVDISYLLG